MVFSFFFVTSIRELIFKILMLFYKNFAKFIEFFFYFTISDRNRKLLQILRKFFPSAWQLISVILDKEIENFREIIIANFWLEFKVWKYFNKKIWETFAKIIFQNIILNYVFVQMMKTFVANIFKICYFLFILFHELLVSQLILILFLILSLFLRGRNFQRNILHLFKWNIIGLILNI